MTPTEHLRAAWEAGFELCVKYHDNWIHFKGEQKERQWREYLAAHPLPEQQFGRIPPKRTFTVPMTYRDGGRGKPMAPTDSPRDEVREKLMGLLETVEAYNISSWQTTWVEVMNCVRAVRAAMREPEGAKPDGLCDICEKKIQPNDLHCIRIEGIGWAHKACLESAAVAPSPPAPPVAPETAGLSPCPFCGEKSETFSRILRESGTTVFGVRCDNCCASTETFSQAEAIAAWNRRAPPVEPETSPAPVERELQAALGIADNDGVTPVAGTEGKRD